MIFPGHLQGHGYLLLLSDLGVGRCKRRQCEHWPGPTHELMLIGQQQH